MRLKNPARYTVVGTGQLPPGQLPPRTIAPRIVAPPYNSHLGKLPQIIAPGQFPPRIIDPQDRWPWTSSKIPIRIIASRRLCRLKKFYCLSFRLHHNKILYKHKHAFFSKRAAGSPFRITSKIFELLSKVWNVLLLQSFWHINNFTSTKSQNKKVFSSSE